MGLPTHTSVQFNAAEFCMKLPPADSQQLQGDVPLHTEAYESILDLKDLMLYPVQDFCL